MATQPMDEQEGRTFRVGILTVGLVLIVFLLLIGSCNQGYYETLQKCTAAGFQLVRDECIR